MYITEISNSARAFMQALISALLIERLQESTRLKFFKCYQKKSVDFFLNI